ncbi:hypothetical protein BXZ70DRAFT_473376 [Cristinia sonorae]|uniref:Uncharacterized protein n=1 Tax=Cristinia sonorae TaxID=1940300 RepID=A0A8K0UH49_9AGAR|nr:hypothetical protein BXZ70DRAFT_473376 [Cristinia sonorae]
MAGGGLFAVLATEYLGISVQPTPSPPQPQITTLPQLDPTEVESLTNYCSSAPTVTVTVVPDIKPLPPSISSASDILLRFCFALILVLVAIIIAGDRITFGRGARSSNSKFKPNSAQPRSTPPTTPDRGRSTKKESPRARSASRSRKQGKSATKGSRGNSRSASPLKRQAAPAGRNTPRRPILATHYERIIHELESQYLLADGTVSGSFRWYEDVANAGTRAQNFSLGLSPSEFLQSEGSPDVGDLYVIRRHTVTANHSGFIRGSVPDDVRMWVWEGPAWAPVKAGNVHPSSEREGYVFEISSNGEPSWVLGGESGDAVRRVIR